MDESLRDRIPLQKRKIIKKSIAGFLATLVFSGIASFFVVGMLYGSIVGAPAARTRSRRSSQAETVQEEPCNTELKSSTSRAPGTR